MSKKKKQKSKEYTRKDTAFKFNTFGKVFFIILIIVFLYFLTKSTGNYGNWDPWRPPWLWK